MRLHDLKPNTGAKTRRNQIGASVDICGLGDLQRPEGRVLRGEGADPVHAEWNLA